MTLHIRTLLILAIINQFSALHRPEKNRQVIVIDVIDSCNPSIELLNVTILKDESRKSLVNTTLRVHKEINENLRVSLTILRCKSLDSPDTCDNFLNHDLKDICKMIVEKNRLWSPLLENSEPALKCPIKKGDYVIKNGWINAERLPLLVTSNANWKFDLKGFEEGKKEEILCLRIAGRLVFEKK